MSGVTFFVPGPVKGQARTGGGMNRPRFKTNETRLYENRIAMAARDAMAGAEPLDGPLRLELLVAFQPPSSASGKRQREMLAGLRLPTVKPDYDNVAKTMDALKGIVWRDDVIVVDARIRKVYSPTPGLTVTVSEMLP